METGQPQRPTEQKAIENIEPVESLHPDQIEALERIVLDEANEIEVAKTMGVTRRLFKKIVEAGLKKLEEIKNKK